MPGDTGHIYSWTSCYLQKLKTLPQSLVMTSYTASPLIYIVDAASAVCASVQHILESSQHRVFPICNAESFSADILQTGKIQNEDIVLINLETDLTSNFRLLNLMMREQSGPGILLLSKRDGALRPTDGFCKARIGILQTPFHIRDVLLSLKTIS